MIIHIKLGPIEIYSDTTIHQILVLLIFWVAAMQFYAWTLRIDSNVWATTSGVIAALIAWITHNERQISKQKAKQKG
jgi:hypothetical protein